MYDQEHLRLSVRSAIAPVGDRHMFELKSSESSKRNSSVIQSMAMTIETNSFYEFKHGRGSIWLRSVEFISIR